MMKNNPATAPAARAGAQVRGESWRVTVLTDRLLRLEYDPEGRFNDQATQTVLCRDFPVPEFKVTERDGVTEIRTGKLRLFYDGRPFSPQGLRIEMEEPVHAFASVWRFGDRPRDLGGTARTLDGVDGKTELGPGLMSSDGFALMDDSRSALLDSDGSARPRPEGAVDLYFFGYGHDFLGCLRDYYRLTGATPLLPRFAFGNWWSRYYVYTEETYLKLMDDFRDHGIPLSVAVVDMDWHLTRIPHHCGSGWTGYTWNRELFPDPDRFLRELHRRGLKVTLNVHPAEGVGAHEEAYPEFARAMGVDPASGERIPFECTDRRYMDAYFRLLHHPMEDRGVDFWWIDWQQGTSSALPGVDPLWVLNDLHYKDSGRDGRWPITFSRYAGLGSHRYPVGFSGDTYITWESLDFQPYFTANASNVGYTWWSHDIGGHQGGARDDELTARWVQFGVFSPVMRLHSTANDFTGKEPWNYGLEAERTMTEFMRLRRRLIPYLYSINYLTHTRGLPLMRPMYYDNDDWEAFRVPNEYRFGAGMVVCPITKPMDRQTLMGSFDAWLPEGTYHDFFTGRVYRGGRRLRLHRDLRSIPVLVPAGSIVPLDADGTSNGAENPEALEVRVYPGDSGVFEMYEDSGVYGSEPAVTRFELREENGAMSLTAAVSGDASCIPEGRRYTVKFVNVTAPEAVSLPGWTYDDGARTLTLELAPGRGGFEVSVTASLRAPDYRREVFDFLTRAQIPYELKTRINTLVKSEPDKARLLASLALLDLPRPLYGAVTEPVTAGE